MLDTTRLFHCSDISKLQLLKIWKKSGRKIILHFCLIFPLSIPLQLYAFEWEIAAGAWYQSPSGDSSIDKSTRDDDLDLEDDLNYDDQWKPFGRLIFYLPGYFPNIYLMYTPIKWDEKGSKDVKFNVGGETIEADVPFDSESKMNHFDVGFFWGLPYFKKATSDKFNIDLGLNFRLLDVDWELVQKETGVIESESYFLPLPMIYTGVQFEPFKYLGFEFEGRGTGWRDYYFVSLIGRLKLKPYGPLLSVEGIATIMLI